MQCTNCTKFGAEFCEFWLLTKIIKYDKIYPTNPPLKPSWQLSDQLREKRRTFIFFKKVILSLAFLMIIIFLFFKLSTPLTFQTCYWVCFNKLSREWWSRTTSRARLRYPILQLTISLWFYYIIFDLFVKYYFKLFIIVL